MLSAIHWRSPRYRLTLLIFKERSKQDFLNPPQHYLKVQNTLRDYFLVILNETYIFKFKSLTIQLYKGDDKKGRNAKFL